MKLLSKSKKHKKKTDSDEDLLINKELATNLTKLNCMLEANHFDLEVKNNTRKLAKRFYTENFIMAAILEAFSYKDEIDSKELNKAVFSYVPKSFYYNVSITYIQLVILKMIRLDLIILSETNNIYSPNYKITENGFIALQQQTFKNIATSSFFNYKTHKLNNIMLVVTIMSLTVAILAIIFTSK